MPRLPSSSLPFASRLLALLALLPLLACVATAPAPGPAPSPGAAPAAVVAPASSPSPPPLDRSPAELRAELVRALVAQPGNAPLVAATLVAVLWQQHAAEHDAACLQAYAAATRALDAGLADPGWTAALEQDGQDLAAKPPAVVLDLDETVLDNSGEAAREIVWQRPFSEADWAIWVREGGARVLPGAAEFLAHAAERGVEVFYVTNYVPEMAPVISAHLAALGLPVAPGHVLAKDPARGWGSDKTSRRAEVAKTHRVLLLVGDDLGDFVAVDGRGEADRDALVAAGAERWGSRWILLPNPTYGSWLTALFAPDKPWMLPRDERIRRLVDRLDPKLPATAPAP